jgi:hypothetical protein
LAYDVVWAEVAAAFGHAQAQAVEALREIGITYSPTSEEATLRARDSSPPPIPLDASARSEVALTRPSRFR